MGGTAGRVICMGEARRRRGMMTPAPAPEPPVVPDRALVAAAQEAMELADLTRRVEAAVIAWAGLRPPPAAASVREQMPLLVAAIRAEPGFSRETASPALRAALRDKFGDARLSRAALMTPQQVLDLPGVGKDELTDLIEELGARSPLTIPELVTGTGKASLRMSRDGSERIRAMMSLRSRPPISSRSVS